MLLVVITFLLVAVGVCSYIYGAWRLSRYAARISGGKGMAVLLFPPATFWFAFHELEQEGKEFPTTMWLFGFVTTIVLVVVFWTPISLVATGQMDELDKPSGVSEATIAEYGMSEEEAARAKAKGEKQSARDEAAPDEPVVDQPDEPDESDEPDGAAEGDGATNGAAGTNGATNGAAGTNGAAATNAGTTQ